jgi:hypothetical protein
MKKFMIVGGLTAALLCAGSGIALADPDAPDPNGPKCWTSGDSGWFHVEYAPCGWTYSDADGWQHVPPAPGEPAPGT